MSENESSILFVDDDELILKGYRRRFSSIYDVHIHSQASEALSFLEKEGPFPVVISDQRMPGMTGVEFLTEVGKRFPDTVRIMLSGEASMDEAIDAVNEGRIFRFLKKPCDFEVMKSTLEAAIRQYQLITAEKVLLDKTLYGTVTMLGEVLSLAFPLAFAKSIKARRLIVSLCEEVMCSQKTSLTLAAFLSQLGCISVPEDILRKVHENQPLTDEEQKTYEAHPKQGFHLLSKIPRLENVGEMIKHQLDSESFYLLGDKNIPDHVRWGADLLKFALDYAILSDRTGATPTLVTAELKRRTEQKRYDPSIYEAYCELFAGEDTDHREIVEVHDLYKLTIGSILSEDLVDMTGRLLMKKGFEITESIKMKLFSYEYKTGIQYPVIIAQKRKRKKPV